MARYGFLVADGSRGKVYLSESLRLEDSALQIIYDQVHFQSRRKNAEPDSARAGGQPGGTGGFHGFAGDRGSHQGEVESFARDLCRVLHRECRAGHFDKLMIAAPPHFLGLLRKHLTNDCQEALVKTLDKNLLECTGREILGLFAADERRRLLESSP